MTNRRCVTVPEASGVVFKHEESGWWCIRLTVDGHTMDDDMIYKNKRVAEINLKKMLDSVQG